MDFKDQLNRTIHISSPVKRIVCLVPSLTELLYELALEDEIIGITKFCVHPYHFKHVKEIVGGTKKVDIEKIKSLKPDFILCNKEENTSEIVEKVSKIAPTYVSDIVTLEDNKKLILDLGLLLNRRTESLNLIEKLEFKLTDFKKFISDKPYKKVAYFIWYKPWMAVGNNTFINEILHLNKFINIYENRERYPEVTISKIRFEGDPEIVLLSSEPFKFNDEHAFEMATFTNRAVTVFADGEYFSWYGSRLLKAFDYFKELHKKIESHF